MSSLKPVWYSSHESELKKILLSKTFSKSSIFWMSKEGFQPLHMSKSSSNLSRYIFTAWSCLYDLQTKQTNKQKPPMKTLRWIKILQDSGVYHLNIVVSKCRHPASHCWVTSVRSFKFCVRLFLNNLTIFSHLRVKVWVFFETLAKWWYIQRTSTYIQLFELVVFSLLEATSRDQ